MPEVIINGPDGRIEGRYHHTAEPNAPLALILHPHPEQGGSMNSKATYALFKTFADRGFNTMRFNFRGVGKSEGKFSQGEGELADAASVLDWMQTYNTNARACWVAGHSFGAWIAMQLLMRRPELDGFIAVSTPANSQDFTFLAPCPVSGVMIHGDQDVIVPKESVIDLARRLSAQKNIQVEARVVPGASHLFDEKLDQLMLAAGDYLDHSNAAPKMMPLRA
ncbi:MAG: alpha/beta hydrolase [Holosporales bacterium]